MTKKIPVCQACGSVLDDVTARKILYARNGIIIVDVEENKPIKELPKFVKSTKPKEKLIQEIEEPKEETEEEEEDSSLDL